jgi:transposase-like protein
LGLIGIVNFIYISYLCNIKSIKIQVTNCPKCKKSEYVKAGFVKNRQRYKCKNCGYYYSVEKKSDAKTEETRRMGIGDVHGRIRVSSNRSSVNPTWQKYPSKRHRIGVLDEVANLYLVDN